MSKKSARKKGGWKATQTDGKKKKQTKLAIIVLIVILSVLLFGQGIRFIDSLFQPITNNLTTLRSYAWSGKTNLNLVIKSTTVSVLSYDPFENSITLVEIPPETYVEVPGGYGKWQVRAIYDLGQSEDHPVGGKLLADSMSVLLGLPINGIIELDSNNSSQNAYEFIKSIKSNPVKAFSYLHQVQSNLTTVEFGNLAYHISQIRFDKIIDLKLADFNLLSSSTIPDGSDVLVAEPILLDNFILDKLAESKMKEEQIAVAVFNGTKIPGVASQVARMITNMGGNVIISSNASFLNDQTGGELEKSFITSVGGLDNSYTFKRLNTIFPLDCPDNPNCDKMYVDKIASRARINIVVGKDFVSR